MGSQIREMNESNMKKFMDERKRQVALHTKAKERLKQLHEEQLRTLLRNRELVRYYTHLFSTHIHFHLSTVASLILFHTLCCRSALPHTTVCGSAL